MSRADTEPGSAIAFCGHDELGYTRSRTRIAPGAGLVMVETYRLAHLPLVAPDHVRIIATKHGTDYRRGRHRLVFSLALPIAGDALLRAPAYRELEHELRESALAPKIAWSVHARRHGLLHATICSTLAVGAKPVLAPDMRDALRRLGPLHVELRGLFSGAMNLGRLYLCVHPERRDGRNMIRQIQRGLGCSESDLYVVGLFNLVDDLNAREAAALMRLIDRWWDRPLLRLALDHLWLLGATDDLVLEDPVIEPIALVEGELNPGRTPILRGATSQF